MKLVRSVAVLAVVAWAVWVTLALPSTEAARRPARTSHAPVVGGGAEVDRRFTTLEARLATLAAELDAARSAGHETARAPVVPEQPPSDDAARETNPAWYLEQYVRSFEGEGRGSEYFRLAVEAFAPTLLEDIARLVTNSGQDPLLRQKLVEILGNARFAGWSQAIDPLLRVVDSSRVMAVTHAALVSLGRIGDKQTARALEQALWSIADAGVQREAINTVVALAGPGANEAILRMLVRARDDATRAYLITLLQPSSSDLALEAFRHASTLSKPVRLQAALHVANFRTQPIKAFVGEWASTEPDGDVRAALGRASSQLDRVPGWSALKATGKPDADPRSDDPNAWASKNPDMGEQWLELEYPAAMRVHTVRIYEVNVAGCVTQVIGYQPSGRSHVLWSGVDPTETPAVLEIELPTTRFTIDRIKLVLDTNRRPGWSEIDAVELVGPSGRAWASGARASSSFGG